MEIENPVLLFNWTKDVLNTPVPRRAILGLKAAEIDDAGLAHGIDYEPFMMVQADSHDVITIVDKNNAKKSYHMHPTMWMNTLDEYISQYCRLMELLEYKQHGLKWMDIILPDSVLIKLNNQTKERTKKRKVLEIDIGYLKYAGKEKKSSVEENRFCTPQFGAALYLNYFCRSLCTHSNATKKKLSLQYDGQKFRLEDGFGFIPSFTLVDYYWHEAKTGISLSIEITAILLEVQAKNNCDDLWEKAFEEFCTKALPTIAKSRMYFTRNSVARSFFQQIYLEQTISFFEWEGLEGANWKNLNYWENMIDRALIPCGILRRYPYYPDIPDSELDISVAHLWELLKSVEMPINFAEYIERPTHGLAVFCNPKHENVSRFLNELGSGVAIKKQDKLKPFERKKFAMVHKAVKAAISG